MKSPTPVMEFGATLKGQKKSPTTSPFFMQGQSNSDPSKSAEFEQSQGSSGINEQQMKFLEQPRSPKIESPLLRT